MPPPFIAPARGLSAFNCPICNAYAEQHWHGIAIVQHQYPQLKQFATSRCSHCSERLYWHNDAILVPDVSSAPPPNEDLAEEIKADYAEAASIASKSARGAAALLRLCIQKLCIQLGEKGKDINRDIGELVKKGLDVRVQQALDTVRVVGNEAVHPGELDLRDKPAVVGTLFELINLIANDMITQPRLRAEFYQNLPKQKLDGIETRDAKTLNALPAFGPQDETTEVTEPLEKANNLAADDNTKGD